MTDNNETWLPNLVGGVSIWKLAVDLNEPKFMGGRLLVPETEGSESLPVTVRWDLTGLVPLADARADAKTSADVDTAIAEFHAALERVAKVFSTRNSGFDKYKQAFTVPSMDAGAANYFYSPDQKKLFVINWGASPRSMGGRSELIFGYEDWAKVGKGAAVAATGAGLTSAVLPAATDAAKKDEKKEEKKEEKKPDDGKKRPWWIWPLFALIAILLVLLALFLLRACEEPKGTDADASADAKSEAAADGAADAAGDGAVADEAGSADASADAQGDATADAAGDASADASADGGKDGGKDKDGGALSDDDDGDDDDPTFGGSSGGSSGGGKVIVTLGGAGGGNSPTVKSGPHRRHYQADAVKWRVTSGNDKVARTEQRGQRFDVWLGAGRTFQGVGVEWQDKSGKWHAH